LAATPDAILDVLAKETGIDRSGLRLDATFAELDIGSLDFVSALFMLEDKFDITIEPDSLGPTSTINDLVALVTARTGG